MRLPTTPGQSQAPLVEALLQTAPLVRAPFFFPGHKMGSATPAVLRRLPGLLSVQRLLRYDLPELEQLGELLCDEGPVAEAERLAAAAFGAQRTWFLINGSTSGIIAAVLACVQLWQQGEGRDAAASETPLLLLPRNAHKSAVHALVTSGAVPSWLIPEVRRAAAAGRRLHTTQPWAAPRRWTWTLASRLASVRRPCAPPCSPPAAVRQRY